MYIFLCVQWCMFSGKIQRATYDNNPTQQPHAHESPSIGGFIALSDTTQQREEYLMYSQRRTAQQHRYCMPYAAYNT